VELIKEAITKARASHQAPDNRVHRDRPSAPPSLPHSPVAAPHAAPEWGPQIQLDARHLKKHRVVSFARDDASHVAFNVLRTKVHRVLRDNEWSSVAVTSPTAGCGKTMVAVNLAFSLARQTDCKTVLIDLDLTKPAVARTLGIQADQSISQYLEGTANLDQCLVRVDENLIVGLNNSAIKNSSEMIHDKRLKNMLKEIFDSLRPEVLVFDLPPMLASDDAIAFLPAVDSSLLVIAAGSTTSKEVEECVRQFDPANKLLGVVLNKAEKGPKEYFNYNT
jgi:protein-tyrosine kinase